MILLVTNARDLTTDYIVRELRARGASYYRLNTELVSGMRCRIGYESIDDWSIGEVEGGDVSSAYFRRPNPVIVSGNGLEDSENEYLISEWSAYFKSIYYRLNKKWFSSPVNIALAEDKPRQLLVAKNLGFQIPDGVITNNAYDVIDKTSNSGLIVKPLRQALIEGASEKVVFTSQIPKVTPCFEKSISFVPSIYQKEIKKKFDVRVTVVGRKVYPVAIFSQASKDTKVDWRQGGRVDLQYECIELPNDINKKCVELVKELGLGFGAIDLVCDLDDSYWFLEINPNGQWAWIENKTQLPIASSIVDELIRISDAS